MEIITEPIDILHQDNEHLIRQPVNFCKSEAYEND